MMQFGGDGQIAAIIVFLYLPFTTNDSPSLVEASNGFLVLAYAENISATGAAMASTSPSNP
jgi:hypothetical protein